MLAKSGAEFLGSTAAVDVAAAHVPIAQFKLGKNIRKDLGADFDQLVQSIATRGVLEPVIARLAGDGKLELVAGFRRFTAAHRLQQPTIPVVVKDLTDDEVIELQFVENYHRKAMNPMEEAEALAEMRRSNPQRNTVPALAAILKVSPSEVYGRLKLTELAEVGKEAMRRGLITEGHGVLLARLSVKDQESVIRHQLRINADFECEGDEVPSVRDLKRHISYSYGAKLPPIDIDSDEFALQEPALAAAISRLKADNTPFVLVSKDNGRKKVPSNTLAVGTYMDVLPHNVCKVAQVGVVVHGGTPELLQICTDKTCPKHLGWNAAYRQRVDKQKAAANRARGNNGRAKKDPAAEYKATVAKVEGKRITAVGAEIVRAIAKATTSFKHIDLAAVIEELYQTLDLDAGNLFDEMFVAKTRKNLNPLQQLQALQVVIYGNMIPSDWQRTIDKELLQAAKRFKVDVKKLEKAAAEALPLPQKPQSKAKAAAPKKKATKKPAAKKSAKKR